MFGRKDKPTQARWEAVQRELAELRWKVGVRGKAIAENGAALRALKADMEALERGETADRQQRGELLRASAAHEYDMGSLTREVRLLAQRVEADSALIGGLTRLVAAIEPSG